MTQLGIMIEGQEGLSWERWRRICGDVERLGFASLRRSDHLISLMGDDPRDCIECWESLALAAVGSLSNGRLLLGVGAGWNRNEHEVFDIPFLNEKERFDRLEEGITTMRDLWSRTYPKPARNPIPLLIGGKGLKRTIPLVAREAAEWNFSRLDLDMFRESRDALDQRCREIGRDPSSIRRSLMTSVIIGRDRSDLLERASQVREVLPSLRAMSPEEVLENRKDAWLVGKPDEIESRIREVSRLGVELFMLQHFLLDDSDALELLAREVLPAVA